MLFWGYSFLGVVVVSVCFIAAEVGGLGTLILASRRELWVLRTKRGQAGLSELFGPLLRFRFKIHSKEDTTLLCLGGLLKLSPHHPSYKP